MARVWCHVLTGVKLSQSACVVSPTQSLQQLPAHACSSALSADAAFVVMLQASSFMMFPDMNTACRAASVLRTETAVDAVEVFDRASRRECEADEALTKLVVDIKGADPGAAALLIECRGEDAQTLQVSPRSLLVALFSIRKAAYLRLLESLI